MSADRDAVLADLREAYERAERCWRGWDYPQRFAIGEFRCEIDGPSTLDDGVLAAWCRRVVLSMMAEDDGLDWTVAARLYDAMVAEGRNAAFDCKLAAQYAASAVVQAMDGRVSQARQSIRQAMRCEEAHGDDGCFRPMLDLIERLAASTEAS